MKRHRRLIMRVTSPNQLGVFYAKVQTAAKIIRKAVLMRWGPPARRTPGEPIKQQQKSKWHIGSGKSGVRLPNRSGYCEFPTPSFSVPSRKLCATDFEETGRKKVGRSHVDNPVKTKKQLLQRERVARAVLRCKNRRRGEKSEDAPLRSSRGS